MRKIHRQSLIGYGQPLCETIVDCPAPHGSEVLVRIERCGVCHSDLHVQDGYFALGNDKHIDITQDRALPFTLGHEIAGVVEEVGSSADSAMINRPVAVYPWIGCGVCAVCRAGEENLCSQDRRHLGVSVDGGFASHILIPHRRYLLDYEPISPGFAGLLMCSGLTAYAALKRIRDRAASGPILLVGCGGVGMMALALARAMFKSEIIVADISPDKRAAALTAGASAAYDPGDPQSRKEITAKTGGLLAVCDFVGSDKSLQFATGLMARGGKVVVTGLLGGSFSIAAVMFAIKAMTIEGSLTGTLAEARELLELARTGAISPIPMRDVPLAQAQSALDDLRAGRVIGRTVLSI